MPRQPQCRVIRLRPGRAEKHLVDMRRRNLCQLLRQKHRRRSRTFEEGIVIGQLIHLPRRRLRQLRPAVAEIDAPKPGHPVEDFIPLAVIDERPFGPCDDARTCGAKRFGIGERMQMVRGVNGLHLLR